MGFKNWLIHKLGGYTEEDMYIHLKSSESTTNESVHRYVAVPPNTKSFKTSVVCDIKKLDTLNYGPEQLYSKIFDEEIKDLLISDFGKFIVDNRLYSEIRIDTAYDPDYDSTRIRGEYEISVIDLTDRYSCTKTELLNTMNMNTQINSAMLQNVPLPAYIGGWI